MVKMASLVFLTYRQIICLKRRQFVGQESLNDKNFYSWKYMSNIPVSFVSPPDNLHPWELDCWRSALTWVWSESHTQSFGYIAKILSPTITAPFYRNDLCVFVLQYDWTNWEEIILFKTDTVFWLLNSLCKLFSLAWSQWASVEKLKFQCFLFFSEEYPIGFLAQHQPFIILPLPVFDKLQLFPMCPLEGRDVCNFIVWLHFWSFTQILVERTWKYHNLRPEPRMHSWVKTLYPSFFCPSFVYAWVYKTPPLPSPSTFWSHWPFSVKFGTSEYQKYMIYDIYENSCIEKRYLISVPMEKTANKLT